MYRKFFKRASDILVSLVAMIFVVLIVVVFAPFIYFTDRGPVFYNAPRLGKDGKTFKMYKLRSMRVNAPDIRNSDGSTYNGDDDPRVTRIGRFLRKTSIDEFPQFLNVLKGDMSLIGPRPTVSSNNIKLEEMDELRRKHYTVRPGITGYSQAFYRNSASQEQKYEHDAFYADNISFALDMKIILQTVKSVLKRENIYVSTEEKPAQKETTEVGGK